MKLGDVISMAESHTKPVHIVCTLTDGAGIERSRSVVLNGHIDERYSVGDAQLFFLTSVKVGPAIFRPRRSPSISFGVEPGQYAEGHVKEEEEI